MISLFVSLCDRVDCVCLSFSYNQNQLDVMCALNFCIIICCVCFNHDPQPDPKTKQKKQKHEIKFYWTGLLHALYFIAVFHWQDQYSSLNIWIIQIPSICLVYWYHQIRSLTRFSWRIHSIFRCCFVCAHFQDKSMDRRFWKQLNKRRRSLPLSEISCWSVKRWILRAYFNWKLLGSAN